MAPRKNKITFSQAIPRTTTTCKCKKETFHNFNFLFPSLVSYIRREAMKLWTRKNVINIDYIYMISCTPSLSS